ncbi:MAG: hypothetical protein NZO16_06345 [Deltaproteobacteria bacterium]|nr:hypothetical protein [Deltaproteobacteria bacterium]
MAAMNKVSKTLVLGTLLVGFGLLEAQSTPLFAGKKGELYVRGGKGRRPIGDVLNANQFWLSIMANGIGTASIQNGAVTNDKIADETIKENKLDAEVRAKLNRTLAEGEITSREIRDETIRSTDLASGAVTSTKIQDGAIDDAKIAIGGIGPNKLQAGAINNSSMFGTGVVPGSALQNGVVTKQKLGLDHLNLPYIVWTGASQGPISAANFYPISGVSPGSMTVGQVFMFVPQDCSKLTFKVQLANAPGGTGKTRTFELVNKDGNSIDPDGSGPLTKMEISLTNTATSQAQTFNVPSHTIQHLALKNSETGGPTTTPATWFIVCE